MRESSFHFCAVAAELVSVAFMTMWAPFGSELMTSKEISAMKPLEFSTSIIAEDPSLVSDVGENPCNVPCVGVDCSFVSGAGGGP